MPLSDEEIGELHKVYQDLISFYQTEVKEVIVASERLNTKQELSLPSIVEVRSAFDHVARSHVAMLGISTDKGVLSLSNKDLKDYCEKNLEKAHGHLYRAAYDAYDLIALSLTQEIDSILDETSHRALFTIIPDVNERIIKPYSEAKSLVTKEKVLKDVTSKAEEEEQFEQYEIATNQLFSVKTVLLGYMDTIVAFDSTVVIENEVKTYIGLYTRKAIHAVIKNATDTIFIPYEDAKGIIAKHINSSELSLMKVEAAEEYKKAIDMLLEVKKVFLRHNNALIEYDKEDGKEKSKALKINIVVAFIFFIAGLLIPSPLNNNEDTSKETPAIENKKVGKTKNTLELPAAQLPHQPLKAD